jgi:N-methylhydantoinase A
MFRLGVDIGGTFTDIVLLDEQGKTILSFKEPSTPENFIDGAIRGVKEILARNNLAADDIAMLAHGATIATNAVIERAGPKIGLITTKGFRDILEQGRGARPPEFIYDIRRPRAEALVRRRYRIGVGERVDSDGLEVRPLATEDVTEALQFFRSEGVKSIAVCLLFSYLNPAHERQIKEIAMSTYPEADIHLSSDIHPEIREYERFSVTALNAYVGPITKKYLSGFEAALRALGIKNELYVMQSNGGLSSAQVAASRPITTFFSGPAGGVVAGRFIANQIKIPNAVMTDMGGTSFEVAMIRDGSFQFTTEKEIGGYPVNITSLDINTIGAGGGSIAWVDEVGGLKVGPRSAGAKPGPACYGLGGTEATTTDANLVLGRTGAGSLLGGRFKMSIDLARKAVREKVAEPLKMDVEKAAQGMITILNSKMAGAIRALTVKRGVDVREFGLIVYGGAGPLHAVDLADELQIPWVIIPPSPGTNSALGLTLPDVAHDYVQTILADLKLVDPTGVDSVFNGLEASGVRDVKTARSDVRDMVVRRSVDLKYANQTFTLTVEVDSGRFSQASSAAVRERFHQKHEAMYGLRFEQEPIEIVNLRVSVIGKLQSMRIEKSAARSGMLKDALKGSREVFFFGEQSGFRRSPIYDSERLPAGAAIEGGAVIEQENSTIIVPPTYTAKIDDYRNTIIGKQEWQT